MGTQKGRLFELARVYQTYQKQDVRKRKITDEKKPVKVKGEHYDEGRAISLSYNFEMYPEVLYDSHQRQAPVSQMSFFDNDKSEAFYVEPFDVEKVVDVPYREIAEEDDDAKLEKIARGFAAGSEAETVEDAEDSMKDMEAKIDDMIKSVDDSSPMALGEQVATKEATTERAPSPQDTADTGSVPDARSGEVKPYEASDEEFAKDIGAILQGQKVYDAGQKKAVSKTGVGRAAKEESNPQARSGGDTEDMLDPAKSEHKIFEKIAQSMAYANSYDLGSIALNEKFELMDREIEKEEIDKVLREKKSKGIQEAEVIEHEAPSASMGLEKYNPDTPLDNSNGGRLVRENLLLQGDLILTSSSGTFDVIDGALGSESIAGVYLGGDKLLTRGGGGALEEKSVQAHLGNKGVMAVLRHQEMSPEKGSSVTDALTKLRVGPDKNQPDNWLKIGCPAFAIHPDVCDSKAGSEKQKCNAYAGKVNLGTVNNDSFMCAESIISAFEKNQTGFVPPLSKVHNGSLKYFGHLKNNP